MAKMRLTSKLITIGILAALPGSAEEQGYTELTKAIEAAHSPRLQYFMNGHFVWTDTEIAGTASSGRRYEYWARDGQYFRFDEQGIANGVPTGRTQRTIVRPEGYGRFVSNDTDGLGAVVDMGSAATGQSRVLGMGPIDLANKVAFQSVTDYFAAWPKRERDLVGLELVDEKEAGIFFSITREVEDGRKKIDVRLSANDYRVLHYTYRFDSPDKTQWATNDATYTYDSTVPDLVRTIKVVGESNFGPPFESTFELLEHDPSPAPLAIFDVGLPTAPQGWSRRLVLLAAGIAMIATWLLWRKKQTVHQ